ncbi:unnamed protein product [Anisakis simplex]|uniref:BED-type domain-containing protein n=1 Tax=Anisakis simplex TaxID=6269 RepID=A0A0M3KAH6_ANISI|nr:unnamed protein product [Anisakis simplex]
MSASSPPTPEEALSCASNTSSPVPSSQAGARLAQSVSTPVLGALSKDDMDDASSSSDAIIIASPSTTQNAPQKQQHSTLRNSTSLASHLKRLISNSSPISTNTSNNATNHSTSNSLATAFDNRILNKQSSTLLASSSKLDDCLMRRGVTAKSNSDSNTNSALLNKLAGIATSSAQNLLLTNAVISNADSKNASANNKSKATSAQDALAKLIHSSNNGMMTASAAKGNQKQTTASTSSSKTNGATNNSSGGGEVRRQRRPFKQSTVWDHFLKLSDGNVQCVHCAKILKRKDSSTKTMWGHLRAIHFKGRDWTALQQQAQSGRSLVVNEAVVTNVDDSNSIYTDAALGAAPTQTAQSWLEEQLGISSTCSPSNDENNQFTLLRTNESSSSLNTAADLSDLEASDISNIAVHKRLNEIYYNNETPTQPYVKRNRPTSYSPNTTTTSSTTDLFLNTSSSKLNSSSTNGCLAAVRAALAGQQKNAVDDCFVRENSLTDLRELGVTPLSNACICLSVCRALLYSPRLSSPLKHYEHYPEIRDYTCCHTLARSLRPSFTLFCSIQAPTHCTLIMIVAFKRQPLPVRSTASFNYVLSSD